jgi:hypothetical protein
MKLPRFTVRNLMFITTIFAVGLFVAQGFWEGMPPRSVVHCILHIRPTGLPDSWSLYHVRDHTDATGA